MTSRALRPLLLLPFFFACTKKEAPPAEPKAPAEAKAPAADTSAPAAGRGQIEVTVKFEGQAPEMKLQDRSHDRFCQRLPTKEETVLVADDGTLRNTFVRITEGIDPEEAIEPPAEPIVIDQKDCMFRPRVAVAVENQKVHVLNSDKTLHNVHGYRGEPARSIFNHAQLAGGKPLEKKFLDGGEIVQLRCDIHPWMANYIAISTHPYFATVRDAGPVMLKDVPPGKVTVETWHELYGFKKSEVRVRAGETAKVAVTYTPADAAE